MAVIERDRYREFDYNHVNKIKPMRIESQNYLFFIIDKNNNKHNNNTNININEINK